MYGQEITPKPGKASDFNALFGLFSIFVLASFHFPLYAREYRSTPKYATGSSHAGRIKDAYCFSHAQLICWECAAREHRTCKVDSAGKAISAVQSNIAALKADVNTELNKARSLCKSDQTFTDSKKRTLNDLSDLENRLDSMYSSAKRQITIMRSEVDSHNKEHLDHRKTFYDQVSILLELNCLLENFRDQDPVSALAEIETMNRDLESVKRDLNQPNDLNGDSIHQIKFVADKGVHDFLRAYSSIGFLDTVTESPLHSARNNPAAPKSLSHILNRGIPTDRSLNDV